MFSRRNILISSIAASGLFVSSAYSDAKFVSPAAGDSIRSSTITVEFKDGGEDPPLSDFTSYTLQLCAGSSETFEPIFSFSPVGDFSESTYTAKLTNLALGGPDKNAYFLRTIGVTPKGSVINYSDRFSIPGMTGQFDAKIKAALADVSGATDVPPAENNVANAPKAAAGAGEPSADVGDPKYQVPYTMQTGKIRYAPMPMKAPSKITFKGDARQFPTSAYTIWSRSGMPPPDATQTYTESYTWSVSSMEPTIAPQPPPDDMQKFLNRWRD